LLFREISQDALEYSRRHKRSYYHDQLRMAYLLQWFGDRPADSISPLEIERRFAEQDWLPATFNRYRSLLSLTYRLGIRNGKVQNNPARSVDHRLEDNTRVRFLDKQEEANLRAKIRERCPEREAEFDLALYTGMRRGEQYGLRWGDVDFERHQLTIPRSKNGSMRHVPMIGIGAAVTRRPLPHHRTYGSVHGGSSWLR
jgi:integrase